MEQITDHEQAREHTVESACLLECDLHYSHKLREELEHVEKFLKETD